MESREELLQYFRKFDYIRLVSSPFSEIPVSGDPVSLFDAYPGLRSRTTTQFTRNEVTRLVGAAYFRIMNLPKSDPPRRTDDDDGYW